MGVVDVEKEQLRAERDAALARVREAREVLGAAILQDGQDGGTPHPALIEADDILASVDTSVLAERDAEKWDEGAEATTEYLLDVPGLPADPPANPYRALAEGGDL